MIKINYVKQFKDHYSEFDGNENYYIIEVDAKKFDQYWNQRAYLGENFETSLDCKRIVNYSKILNEILHNPENQISYPIIKWVNEKHIKVSQGRHRIRAIIDSGVDTIQLAIKVKDYDILNGQLNIKIIKTIQT